MFKTTSTKLAVLVVLCGLFPLLLFGLISINKARTTSIDTITAANLEVASEVAGRVRQYMDNLVLTLTAVSENVNRDDFTERQKKGILRNFALNFESFLSLSLYNLSGEVIATTLVDPQESPAARDKLFAKAIVGKTSVSPVFLNKDNIPTTKLFLPQKKFGLIAGVLVAEVDLLHLWHLIDDLKVGSRGALTLTTSDGQVFASGYGRHKKRAVLLEHHPDFDNFSVNLNNAIEASDDGEDWLIVTKRLNDPYHWYITVEQPVSEAYALARQMTFYLILLAVLMLFCAVLVGYYISDRELIKPFKLIMARIHALSQGKLDGEVCVPGQGEFVELAKTLNDMSLKLIDYQKKIVSGERFAFMGRVAASLAHDLKHPIQNVENFVKMLARDPQNDNIQTVFFTTVSGEIDKMQTYLTNFAELSRDLPHMPIHSNINLIILKLIDGFIPRFNEMGITHSVVSKSGDVHAQVDIFSFQRLISNILVNAIEAMPSGGQLTLTIETLVVDNVHQLQITVTDTGTGIPEHLLPGIFDELNTTKKGGLGLGLAICNKIVAQHHGHIYVESNLSVGTEFQIILPLKQPQFTKVQKATGLS